MENQTRKIEKTQFETEPVQSLTEAIHAFVEAYDVLQLSLAEFDAGGTIADALRTAMYGPVRLEGESRPSVSLYEIGVVHFPNETGGRYDINSRKMKKALTQRGDDVQAMFVQENGILPRIIDMLLQFTEEEQHEFVYAAVLRFVNECRRLTAMLE